MILSLLLFAQIHGVQFQTSVSPTTVYVGQQVSFDASMRANVYAQTSFQTNPEYIPPDIKGVTVYDFPFDTLTSIRDVNVSGLTFKQYTYHRAVFPITPGSYMVPAGLLVYSLPNVEDEFLPNVDTLRSKPQSFVVLPLPTNGQPPDFSGAVGDFTLSVHTDNQSFHSGTAFVLSVTVTGFGNIDLLPRPTLQIPWATVVNSVERVTWDSTSMLVRGAKEFQWVVNPQMGGQLVIPALRYSYFNPTTKQYMAATTPPTPIKVAGGRVSGALAKGVMAHDSLGNSPFPVLMQAVQTHWILAILVVLLILAVIVALILMAQNREPVD